MYAPNEDGCLEHSARAARVTSALDTIRASFVSRRTSLSPISKMMLTHPTLQNFACIRPAADVSKNSRRRASVSFVSRATAFDPKNKKAEEFTAGGGGFKGYCTL